VAPKNELRQVAESIESLVMWVRRQAPVQMSSSTVTALDTLLRAGPMRISELSERESISQPGVTSLVTRLERSGYAERVPDDTDRRATLVRITPAGKAFLAEWHRLRASALRTQLAHLDEADREALVSALPALRRLIAGPSHLRKK